MVRQMLSMEGKTNEQAKYNYWAWVVVLWALTVVFFQFSVFEHYTHKRKQYFPLSSKWINKMPQINTPVFSLPTHLPFFLLLLGVHLIHSGFWQSRCFFFEQISFLIIKDIGNGCDFVFRKTRQHKITCRSIMPPQNPNKKLFSNNKQKSVLFCDKLEKYYVKLNWNFSKTTTAAQMKHGTDCLIIWLPRHPYE